MDQLHRRWLRTLLPALVAGVLAAFPVTAQESGVVVGTVIDAVSQQPIAGAQVTVQGTQLGALSDADGRYRIAGVPAGNYQIRATFIGRAAASRTNVRVTAGGTVEVDFQLREQALRLEGVVVTGVVDPIEGVKIPFSVGRLSSSDMPVPTTHSALAALQGKVAGVTVSRTSGQPGTGVSILLRTPTSIVRNNSPLYVVDGVILGTSFGGTTLDLESVDIENIEVVKGAAAAALYGSRAAGGVINITTNRGQGLEINQTRITARSEFGQSELPKGVPLSPTHHFALNEQGQFIDEHGAPTTDPQRRILAPDRIMQHEWPGQTYDNINRFFQPGQFYTNHISLAHNAESSNFYVTVNNYREKGSIVTNDGYERVNVRLNLDHRMRDDLRLSATAYHNRSFRDNLSGDPFWGLLMYAPDVDLGVRDEQGNFVSNPDPTEQRENPIWRQTTRDNHTWRARTMVNGSLNFQPLSWFRMDGTLSYDRADITRQIYVPKGVVGNLAGDDDEGTDGRLDLREEYADVVNGSVSANFLRNFGDLNTRLTLRYLMEIEENTAFGADSREFWVRDVPRMDIGQDQRTYSGSSLVEAEGYFAQMGLDYAGKYIGDLLIRRDGSSLFGPGNRWNRYYRVSGAWRMGEEAWWPFPQLGEFKLRASQGTAGGRPSFADQYETWSVSSAGSVSKGTLGNRNLGPETTTETEFGLDFIALNRLNVELTWARQTTRDQIIQIPQPAVSGYSNQWQNSGTIEGTTLEATVQAFLVQNPDFTWSTTIVADRSKSEITEWNRVCYFTNSGLTMRCQGANRSEVWGDRFLTGVQELPARHQGSESHFQVNDDGYLVAVGTGNSWQDGLWGTEVEVDGVTYPWGLPIIERDEGGNVILQRIGEFFPDASVGWINQFRIHGLDVHTHLHANIGGQVYNRTRQRLYQHFRHADLNQAGKPEGEKKPIDYYQALYNTNNSTSHFVEDAGFVKLREVALRYSFRDGGLERFRLDRLGLDRLTVGLIGRNLLTFSPYDGYDPEVGGVAVRHDNFNWPNTRTITGMVEITF
jgi:TonB-linked SusC/RagA family outer membrane protein